MKKFLAILLAAATVLALAACGASDRDFDRDDDKDKDDKNTGAWSDVIGGQEEDAPQVSPAPVQPPVQSKQVLFTMYDYDGETTAAEMVVYSDNTFEMKVNLFEGWGKLTGTYFAEYNNDLTCTVESTGFSGVHGDNLKAFVLVYQGDENFIISMTDVDRLGMLDNGDAFVRVAP